MFLLKKFHINIFEYINGEKRDKSDSNDEGEDDFYLEVY